MLDRIAACAPTTIFSCICVLPIGLGSLELRRRGRHIVVIPYARHEGRAHMLLVRHLGCCACGHVECEYIVVWSQSINHCLLDSAAALLQSNSGAGNV